MAFKYGFEVKPTKKLELLMLALDLAATNWPPEAKRSDFHYKDPQTPLRQKKKIKKILKKLKIKKKN